MSRLIASAKASGRHVRVVTYRDGETPESDVAAQLIFRTAEDAQLAAKLIARLGDYRHFCTLCDMSIDPDKEWEARAHMRAEHSGALAVWEGRHGDANDADIILHWFD